LASQLRWVWLPLLVGLAVDATVEECGVEAGLKWPNDVEVEGRKIAGIFSRPRPSAKSRNDACFGGDSANYRPGLVLTGPGRSCSALRAALAAALPSQES